jgi:hypothetical protein
MRRVSTFLHHRNSKKKKTSMSSEVSHDSSSITSSAENAGTPNDGLGRKKSKSRKMSPIVVNAPNSTKWRVVDDSGSDDDTIDDIRRPSGLGRSVSISSQQSAPPSPFSAIPEESPFPSARNSYIRQRALSSPNHLGSFAQKAANRASVRSSILASVGHTSFNPSAPVLPSDVWLLVLGYLPRADVVQLATTCRDFHSASKRVLYHTIDSRTLKDTQFELLVKLLAYRADLTDLIRVFECHTWPEFYPPHPNGKRIHSPTTSFSPMLTATFTIAFQNMYRITSLVLPSFDSTFLRHHSAFGLTRISFLNESLTEAETTKVFTWLNGQTNITQLELPNLVEQDTSTSTSASHPNDPNGHNDTQNGSPYPSSNTNLLTPTNGSLASSTNLLLTPNSARFASSTSLAPVSPFTSPTLLPQLSTYVGPPSILSSLLLPNEKPRPIKRVTLNINKTLYTGLRPAALVSTLQSLKLVHLALRFGPAADKRTIAKVLGACVALFPSPNDSEDEDYGFSPVGKTPHRLSTTLKSLEIVLADSSEGSDQVDL